MFSERMMEALTHEVVGQPQAIHSVVRSATRLLSGLTPLERSWCAHLFIGPPGTGRAHLVRTLARHLHGDETAHTVSCNSGGQPDPWTCFVQQLAPLLTLHEPRPSLWCGPPKVILVQDLERAHKEFFPLLARLLETGQVPLPGGREGSLHNCILFLLSGLGTDRILATNEIGFSSSAALPEDGADLRTSLVETCTEEAKQTFGLELLAQLDDLVVFRKLEDEHLGKILEGHFARMNRWFERRGVTCELRPAARDFLLERASQQRLMGARDLISIHRREVEFPLADLLVSSQLEAGSRVVVDHEVGAKHLQFTVDSPEEPLRAGSASAEPLEIPVTT